MLMTGSCKDIADLSYKKPCFMCFISNGPMCQGLDFFNLTCWFIMTHFTVCPQV